MYFSNKNKILFCRSSYASQKKTFISSSKTLLYLCCLDVTLLWRGKYNESKTDRNYRQLIYLFLKPATFLKTCSFFLGTPSRWRETLEERMD